MVLIDSVRPVCLAQGKYLGWSLQLCCRASLLLAQGAHGALEFWRVSFGYGSIPMKIPFLGGWTSINPSYFDVSKKGVLLVLTHCHLYCSLCYSMWFQQISSPLHWKDNLFQLTFASVPFFSFRGWNQPWNQLGFMWRRWIMGTSTKRFVILFHSPMSYLGERHWKTTRWLFHLR